MRMLYLLAALLLCTTATAQRDTCDYYTTTCGKKPCGPAYNRANRTHISAASAQAPYTFVMHQYFNRVISGYSSTGSFIAPNAIITAWHNVKNPALIQEITFTAPNGTTKVTVKRKDVNIVIYRTHVADKDIALIVFKNPAQIAPVYAGHFALPSTGAKPTGEVHLTGYPCDEPDKMMDKTTTTLYSPTSPSSTCWGYDMCTCTGDSGAPLWQWQSNTATLLGIHHGFIGGYFAQNCINLSSAITPEVIQWIKANVPGLP